MELTRKDCIEIITPTKKSIAICLICLLFLINIPNCWGYDSLSFSDDDNALDEELLDDGLIDVDYELGHWDDDSHDDAYGYRDYTQTVDDGLFINRNNVHTTENIVLMGQYGGYASVDTISESDIEKIQGYAGWGSGSVSSAFDGCMGSCVVLSSPNSYYDANYYMIDSFFKEEAFVVMGIDDSSNLCFLSGFPQMMYEEVWDENNAWITACEDAEDELNHWYNPNSNAVCCYRTITDPSYGDDETKWSNAKNDLGDGSDTYSPGYSVGARSAYFYGYFDSTNDDGLICQTNILMDGEYSSHVKYQILDQTGSSTWTQRYADSSWVNLYQHTYGDSSHHVYEYSRYIYDSWYTESDGYPNVLFAVHISAIGNAEHIDTFAWEIRTLSE